MPPQDIVAIARIYLNHERNTAHPLHVTLAFRENGTADDMAAMFSGVQQLLSDGPLVFQIGSAIKVGERNDIDAMVVKPVCETTRLKIRRFWTTHNRRTGVGSDWEMNLHITCNTDAKRTAMKKAIYRQGGVIGAFQITVKPMDDTDLSETQLV